ncbi:Stk1 family PASTA domain-containing Ser/Thr kinase [soil metagenome]
MSTNTTDPLIGRLIDGRYQVRSRIARGGMATVYLATDLRLERRVAIKVMHGHLADDSQYKARFIQEARSAARLAHPNVVNVYDQGQDGETAYLIMEYLPGITLRDLLQEHKVLTTVQALDIMGAILAGLAAAHKNGIVHRDLKPENVLLADDGRIKISDFGLARAASANTATGNALLGTIAYLSPELVTRGVADTRSDIYAVGIMLYEMLAGEQPYKGEQAFQIANQHANDTVPTPSTKNPRVPAELDEMVLWATARDPDQRPRDAKTMLEQLLQIEALLREDSPAGSTSAHRTAVMPSTMTPRTFASNDDETQVLPPKARHRTGPITAESVTTLATKSDSRHRRGFWLFGLVIVIAALAGGTGWYFGAGPGAHVTVVDVAGATPDDAREILTEAGLTVSQETGEISSPTVPLGAVAQTDPEIGSSVVKNSAVTLLISTGPKLLPITNLKGLDEAAAIKQIADQGFSYDAEASFKQFDSAVPLDKVIVALAADGTTDLSTLTQYGELQKISMVISAGPLPEVAGKSVADATAILAGYDLTAQTGREDYNDRIGKGLVIGIDSSAGPVKPGTTVTLILSKGKEQIAVPSIEGKVWNEAQKLLTDAGFVIKFKSGSDQILANSLPSSATVKSSDPDGGQVVDKGSAVTVDLQSG